jgi:type I restriction enzyme S subunit
MRASYPTYKSTSIPWLPEMPEHWEVRKAKFIFRKEKREVREDDDVVTAFRDGQVTLRKNRREDGFTIAVHEIGYQGIRKGDLVIHGMDAFAGAIGVSDSDGKASPVYNACTLRVDGNMNYFCHAIRQMSKSGFIQSLAKGIRERSTDFRYDTFGQQYLPFPPLTEQTAIANYLNAKSEQINRFIEKKQKLIALLKEQKQAVINELLEDKEGKWERRKLKYFCSLITKGTTPSTEGKEFTNAGVRFLKAENITENGLSESPLFFIDEETNQLLKRSQLKTNDILIVIAGATIGRTAIITESYLPANTNQAVCLLRLKKGIDPKFIRLLLSSPKIQERVRFDAVQSAQPNLSMGVLGDFLLPYPKSESERQQLVKTIEEESLRIDAVIQRINIEIEKVKELKQSLIAEVVTGRIKVV